MQKEAGEYVVAKVDIKKEIEKLDAKLVELVGNEVLALDVNAHLCIAGNHFMLALLALEAAEKSAS